MSERSNWVDVAKGIGIILVVYAHLLSSAYHAGIEIPEAFFKLSDSVVYSFHMPFFFFLSGLFAENSLNKRGVKDYLLDKFSRIAYPYIIWSAIQVSVEVIFASQTQEGATLSDLLAILYNPWGQFWFLYALLWMHLTFVGLSFFGKHTYWVMTLAGITLYFFSLPIGSFALPNFCLYFIFFASGIIFKSFFMSMEKYNKSPWAAILFLVTLLGSAIYIFQNIIPLIRLANDYSYLHYFLYLSILGIFAFSSLSQYIAQKEVFSFFETLGRYSLQIYLVHMLAGVGTRMILLYIFGIENWIIHIVLGVMFALVIPILLQKISDRLNFPYLFQIRSAMLK